MGIAGLTTAATTTTAKTPLLSSRSTPSTKLFLHNHFTASTSAGASLVLLFPHRILKHLPITYVTNYSLIIIVNIVIFVPF